MSDKRSSRTNVTKGKGAAKVKAPAPIQKKTDAPIPPKVAKKYEPEPEKPPPEPDTPKPQPEQVKKKKEAPPPPPPKPKKPFDRQKFFHVLEYVFLGTLIYGSMIAAVFIVKHVLDLKKIRYGFEFSEDAFTVEIETVQLSPAIKRDWFSG